MHVDQTVEKEAVKVRNLLASAFAHLQAVFALVSRAFAATFEALNSAQEPPVGPIPVQLAQVVENNGQRQSDHKRHADIANSCRGDYSSLVICLNFFELDVHSLMDEIDFFGGLLCLTG